MFRYLAAVVLCLRHEEAGVVSTISETPRRPFRDFTDKDFFVWMTNPAKPLLREGRQYHLSGFYQHQFYTDYRDQILQYIRDHPEDKLITDRRTFCLSKQLREHDAPVPKYRLVCHLRLEDFCDEGLCIHPDAVVAVLRPLLEREQIAPSEACFVLNFPTLPHEIKYLQYVLQGISLDAETGAPGPPRMQIVSNDVMMDYHIMRQAEVLVCSCSTLSWMAAFMSDCVREVHMPNYPGRPWETFRRPIPNTHAYDYTCVGMDDLDIILSLVPDEDAAPAVLANLILRPSLADLIPGEKEASGGDPEPSLI